VTTTSNKATAIEKYRQVRRMAFTRMGELRERMDTWLDAHEDSEPTMADLATLEGMHADRVRIVTELESAERAMIDALLRARPDSPAAQ
jgi:hypothetical protein